MSRDIVSGLVMLALVAWGSPFLLGVVLLIEAIIPVGDTLLILAAKGSTKTALSLHGLTAALMTAGAIPLLMGVAWDTALSVALVLIRGRHADADGRVRL